MNIYFDANEIYEAGTKSINSASFKYQSQAFELNHLLETAILQEQLKNGTYKPEKGTNFVISERGKIRHITTNTMVDKTINHLMCDNILGPAISPFLIYDNSASQKGKGVAFHRKRFEENLHRFYRKYKSNNGYILLIDFSGYYASIPHKKCMEVIEKLLKNINEDEKKITLNILNDILNISEGEKGVNIGSQPSQNIGIAFPNEIDTYIKVVKGCKYYGRYTDDSYVIHKDKKFLKQLYKEIREKANDLGLVINPKKTRIVKLSQTFKVLQIKYSLTETGRVIKRINSKSVTRERKKLKAYKRLLDKNKMQIDEIENSFKSWIASNYKVMSMQQIENMSQLYYDLFRRKIEWKNHGKLHYLMEHKLKTLS